MQKLLRNEMSGSMIRLELKSDGNDSDSEIRRVPEMRGKSPTPGTGQTSSQTSTPPKRRGSGSVDKEGKRLKRLLRNRVSAQQARERKKAYVSDLESRVKELEQRNAELEEKTATLGKENHMLRQIVKNTALHKNSGSPATDLVVEKVDH